MGCSLGYGLLAHGHKCIFGYGSNDTTRGPQVFVLVSFSRVPFWVPIVDPHSFAQGSLTDTFCPFETWLFPPISREQGNVQVYNVRIPVA